MSIDPSLHGVRLAALRRQLVRLGVDGVIVPRFDEHQGEYCAPHDERLAFLSGFTGSAGLALVLRDRALMFVDGRYQVQVRQQVDLEHYSIEHYDDAPVDMWLERNGQAGLRIGYNPMLIPVGMADRLEQALTRSGGTLVTLSDDPVDLIWPDQPPRSLGQIAAFPLAMAGETATDKRARLGRKLSEVGADLLVETQPDNIAWLLNVRGSDVAYNPFPQSFLLLGADGKVEWFVDERKLTKDRQSYELDDVKLRSPKTFLSRLAEIAAGHRVLLDADLTSAAAAFAVKEAGGTVLRQTSPIALAKAFKNVTELAGFRAAHLADGAAWVEFLARIAGDIPARNAAGKPVTELEAEAMILSFREQQEGFVFPSFRSISAVSANAAMCHYAATADSDAPLTSNGFYLLDSGGQYRSGTTDATRTIALGPISDEARQAYTAVLKGFVAMMTLRFPVGTFGHQIDAVARRPLWDVGLDYDHGTGHGVGHFLSVHEQPHRFEKLPNTHRIEAGLVMTVEPGYYKAGAFGMRIENQVEVVPSGDGFLQFDSMTCVPIDLSPVEMEALSDAERAFLNTYHKWVRSALMDRLSDRAQAWLLASTAPLVVS